MVSSIRRECLFRLFSPNPLPTYPLSFPSFDTLVDFPRPILEYDFFPHPPSYLSHEKVLAFLSRRLKYGQSYFSHAHPSRHSFFSAGQEFYEPLFLFDNEPGYLQRRRIVFLKFLREKLFWKYCRFGFRILRKILKFSIFKGWKYLSFLFCFFFFNLRIIIIRFMYKL